MSKWLGVAPATEILPDKPVCVEFEDIRVLVFNLDGEFYALQDVCTHDGGNLNCAKIDGQQIICPRHGARFSIRNGAALSAPAYEAIRTFPTRINNGEVQVCDNRWG